MHPEDNDDARPTVRRHPSLAPDGELDLNWAYDTPLGAPRRGLDSPQSTPLPAGSARPSPEPDEELALAGTISPLLARRRDTPPATPAVAEDPWDQLGVGVFLVGVGTLAIAGLLAVAGGVLLLLSA